MNIIEALKTRRKIRRRSGDWFDPHVGHSFTPEQILTEDWEVEGIVIEITEAQVREAWEKSYDCESLNMSLKKRCDRFLSLLGFKI